MIVTFLFLTQQANSKYLELDQMLIDRKIVDEKFEVKDLEKLESLIWYMNDRAIKKFPYRIGNVIFYNSWLNFEGMTFKVSFVGFNSKEDFLLSNNKEEWIGKLFNGDFCEIAYNMPDLMLSNFFKKVLKGNIEVIFLDEKMNTYMRLNKDITGC